MSLSYKKTYFLVTNFRAQKARAKFRVMRKSEGCLIKQNSGAGKKGMEPFCYINLSVDKLQGLSYWPTCVSNFEFI